MKQQPRIVLSVALALILASLACNAFSGGGLAQTQVVAEATSTPGFTQPTITPAVLPSPAQPGVTPSSAPPPATATSTTVCGYSYVFVKDVTIPDDSPIPTGQSFKKTWEVKNNGCKTWPAGTLLVFVSGDQMGGPSGVTIPETASGVTLDISVDLKAPAAAGDYTGNWQIKTPDGILIGATPVFVKIKAVAPTAAATNTLPPAVAITPTPLSVNFTAVYVGGVWSCTSGGQTLYMYTALVTNTGPTTFESVETNIQQPVGTVKNNGSNDTGFQTSPTNADCNAAGFHTSTFPPGATAWVSEFVVGAPLPGGTPARLVVRLCTANGLGGTCMKQILDFTP